MLKNLYLVIKNVSHFFKWKSGFFVGIYFISNFCIHLKYTHFVDFLRLYIILNSEESYCYADFCRWLMIF